MMSEKALLRVSVTELTPTVDGETMKATTRISLCVGLVPYTHVGLLVVPADAPTV